jgi:hypothetical protein
MIGLSRRAARRATPDGVDLRSCHRQATVMVTTTPGAAQAQASSTPRRHFRIDTIERCRTGLSARAADQDTTRRRRDRPQQGWRCHRVHHEAGHVAIAWLLATNISGATINGQGASCFGEDRISATEETVDLAGPVGMADAEAWRRPRCRRRRYPDALPRSCACITCWDRSRALVLRKRSRQFSRRSQSQSHRRIGRALALTCRYRRLRRRRPRRGCRAARR